MFNLFFFLLGVIYFAVGFIICHMVDERYPESMTTMFGESIPLGFLGVILWPLSIPLGIVLYKIRLIKKPDSWG